MILSRYLIIALLLCSVLLAAGCTRSTPAPVPVTPAAGSGLADLALTAADLPPGYTLVGSRAKNISEVGALARDLGWQGGYVAEYRAASPSGGIPTDMIQSIATYPAGNIPDLVALVDRQDRSDPDLTYTDLPASAPGGRGAGFYGKAQTRILIKPTNANPLVSGPENHDVEALVKTDIVEIIFYRGTTFEVIRMTGPGADVATATALAQKAYAKIP